MDSSARAMDCEGRDIVLATGTGSRQSQPWTPFLDLVEARIRNVFPRSTAARRPVLAPTEKALAADQLASLMAL